MQAERFLRNTRLLFVDSGIALVEKTISNDSMFRVTVLGSGSSGNAALLETDRTRLLIDAGLSARRISVCLGAMGIEPDTLDGILLTHEHQDHSRGISVFCKKRELPVFCNKLTADTLQSGGLAQHRYWKIFQNGNVFTIGDLAIQSFSVPHDASDPVGFVIEHNTAMFGVLTDLGFATKLVHERMREVHTLLIETNHDRQLLERDTKRPWAIKQRILSRHGHLSNESAAEIIAESAEHRLRHVILGHLSEDCNSPDLARKTVYDRLAKKDCFNVEITVASRKEITQSIAIA